VTEDDRAFCWGENTGGQLGQGSTTGPETCTISGFDFACSRTPVPVAGGLRFRRVSAGAGFTCGVATDDRVYCWGQNFDGNLGDGTTEPHSSPVAIAGGRRFSQVSAGSQHTCAVTLSHGVFCWGGGSSGKLGDGTTDNHPIPVRVAAGARHFREVRAGLAYTCAVGSDSLAYCWGDNSRGQLGDGTTISRPVPVAVRGGRHFRQLAAGLQHTCGVTTTNTAYCWGSDNHGQLGDGASGFARRRREPTAVLGGLQFRAVSVGSTHSCGATTGNRAYCWGDNQFGQLGDGTTEGRLSPTGVAGGRFFQQVIAGSGSFTCARMPDDEMLCWGNNNRGQLGDGTTTARALPTLVSGAM
jgi:alpha-tubulin suppressor-like RCC1 family protein